MTRADTFNFHVDPIRTEMTGTQQIYILHVYSSDKSKSKGIIADKNLLQFCSADESEPESVIVDVLS